MLYKKNKFMVYLGEIDIKMIEELGVESDDNRSKVLRRAIRKIYKSQFGEARFKELESSLSVSKGVSKGVSNLVGNDI